MKDREKIKSKHVVDLLRSHDIDGDLEVVIVTRGGRYRICGAIVARDLGDIELWCEEE
jgi:uncharacterized protein YaiL (DUF2058 family)